MKAPIANTRGSILIAIAVATSVFMLLMALLLDLGRAWLHASHLQAAADAAALAGAGTVSVRVEVDRDGNVYSQTIILDPDTSRAEALDALNRNIQAMDLENLGVIVTNKEVTVSGLRVTVRVRGTVPMYLLPAFQESYAAIPIRKTASAELIP
ncbi:MAG: pilus assembly protein TadG-related protein [Firmicutes bacterium]|jgi:Flp pilus assembly protein TadG|nr:pilus assembly protein TadG-related protein [Bacillota bacterium]